MHRFHNSLLLLVMPLLLLLLLPLLTQGCVEEERQALLHLKRSFIDPDNCLESWNSSSSQEDCCGWDGITCGWNGGEGHVIKLELSSAWLSGKINPSLLSLKHLEVLDLSGLDFQDTPIPPFIGSFSNLTTLILADAGFGGAIPPQLGMLRNLQQLDLSGNDFQGAPIAPCVGNFSNLKTLYLDHAGFGGAIPPQLGMLRNLELLDLSHNDFLQGTPIPAFIGNFSNLTTLILGSAGFGGAIPPQLGMLPKLLELYILNDDPSGEKTSSFHPFLYVEDFRWISNLSSLYVLEFANVDMGRASDWESSLSRCPLLQRLTLHSCNLTSLHHGGDTLSLPENGFASLEWLDLSHNHKLGKSFIPTWMFSLNRLTELRLVDCSLDGILTEHFGSNLTSLQTLDMSNNPLLHIQIIPDWVPPFNLSFLYLSSCQVGPRFPLWLRTQENLKTLILSSARLHDSLPTWIWDFAPSLNYLDLSLNQFYGVVPDFHPRLSSFSHAESVLDLSSNNFSSQLPAHLSSSNIGFLNLSYNSFSGCLSRLLCHEGRKSKSLQLLDLDNNLLSGNMSDCWGRWKNLKFVSVSNNNLIGGFSNSLTHLGELTSLHLRNNNLSGTLTFLEKHNWTNLVSLDLGINKFNGSMKSTSWKMFPQLRFLMLETNEISGIIPREICNLEYLQILNLARNNLSERIPTCFKNFRGMKVKPERSEVKFVTKNGLLASNIENLRLFVKGRLDEYSKNLGLVTLLDISNNYLSGEIPKGLMDLTWLYSLNLSRNQLTGTIPMNIGDMRSLSSLDLSMNQLLGEIPQTISQLTSLDHLNLSRNNLTGRIPSSTQLQSFDPSSYIGNTLCGKPILEKCDQGDAPGPTVNEREGDDSCIGFYLGFLIGFGAGTSAIFFILLFRQSWRIAYFRIVENILNKLF